MTTSILTLFALRDFYALPQVCSFVENRNSMKLLEFTKSFPDEEPCDLHQRLEYEKAGVICNYCGGTHYRWG